MLCFLFFMNEFYVFNFNKWACSCIDLLPHFKLRKSFLVLSIFHKPQLILCFSLADVIFIGLCYLRILVLDYVSPFTIFCTCCFKFRACRQVPCSTLVSLVPSPFSCSLESFVFAQAEPCFNQTLRAHGCFSPRFQSFPFYLLASVRTGS